MSELEIGITDGLRGDKKMTTRKAKTLKRKGILLLQIAYGMMWRLAILMFAIIGFAEWYFKIFG